MHGIDSGGGARCAGGCRPPPSPPSCEEAPYDVDGNSEIEPLADGLLLLRYFFTFRGDVLINGAVGQNCTRCTAPAIEQFIELALAGCAACGDNVISSGEDCDGANLGGESCTSLGFDGGTLACAACVFDVSGCSNAACGGGTIDPGEECDTNDLNGHTCLTQGFTGGTLACNACNFDTTNCSL